MGGALFHEHVLDKVDGHQHAAVGRNGPQEAWRKAPAVGEK
jgi:hypothetical protein